MRTLWVTEDTEDALMVVLADFHGINYPLVVKKVYRVLESKIWYPEARRVVLNPAISRYPVVYYSY